MDGNEREERRRQRWFGTRDFIQEFRTAVSEDNRDRALALASIWVRDYGQQVFPAMQKLTTVCGQVEVEGGGGNGDGAARDRDLGDVIRWTRAEARRLNLGDEEELEEIGKPILPPGVVMVRRRVIID